MNENDAATVALRNSQVLENPLSFVASASPGRDLKGNRVLIIHTSGNLSENNREHVLQAVVTDLQERLAEGHFALRIQPGGKLLVITHERGPDYVKHHIEQQALERIKSYSYKKGPANLQAEIEQEDRYHRNLSRICRVTKISNPRGGNEVLEADIDPDAFPASQQKEGETRHDIARAIAARLGEEGMYVGTILLSSNKILIVPDDHTRAAKCGIDGVRRKLQQLAPNAEKEDAATEELLVSRHHGWSR